LKSPRHTDEGALLARHERYFATITSPIRKSRRLDVIIKVASCAICGSDLHLMDGPMPTMKSGDILGHEFMGEVVETGSAHNKFRKGDRIVVPFNINCGECRQCADSDEAARL
jgi:threonine dehydrogenase-like Zn-dependent dehydrogenase